MDEQALKEQKKLEKEREREQLENQRKEEKN